MLISRGACLLKNIVTRVSPRKPAQNFVPSRNDHGGWHYRDIGKPYRIDVVAAEIYGGFMWWWILWHCWHEWGHIVGEFEVPDPSKWTDEELGISPED